MLSINLSTFSTIKGLGMSESTCTYFGSNCYHVLHVGDFGFLRWSLALLSVMPCPCNCWGGSSFDHGPLIYQGGALFKAIPLVVELMHMEAGGNKTDVYFHPLSNRSNTWRDQSTRGAFKPYWRKQLSIQLQKCKIYRKISGLTVGKEGLYECCSTQFLGH